MKYRLEYKETAPRPYCWHHERTASVREENTNGWVTVLEDVTTKEIWLFECLLEFATGKKCGWNAKEVQKYATRFAAFQYERDRLKL